MKRCYKAGEMVFFSYANAPFSKVMEWAQRYFGDIQCGMRGESRQSPVAVAPFDERMAYDTHQAHVVWGCRAYDMYDERRLALLLLNNMIGGPGQNSLLNVALREQRGYVYAVESSVVNYTDTGLFTVYFGTDGKYGGAMLAPHCRRDGTAATRRTDTMAGGRSKETIPWTTVGGRR